MLLEAAHKNLNKASGMLEECYGQETAAAAGLLLVLGRGSGCVAMRLVAASTVQCGDQLT